MTFQLQETQRGSALQNKKNAKRHGSYRPERPAQILRRDGSKFYTSARTSPPESRKIHLIMIGSEVGFALGCIIGLFVGLRTAGNVFLQSGSTTLTLFSIGFGGVVGMICGGCLAWITAKLRAARPQGGG